MKRQFSRQRCHYRHFVLAIATITIWSVVSVISVISRENLSQQRVLDHNRQMALYEQDGKPLLTLFTTFRNNSRKMLIHRNTIKSWGLLRPYVQPVLISNGKTNLDKYAELNGWEILPATRVNTNGLPIIKYMFEDVQKKFDSVFYGFSNADILFDKTLINTLKGINEHISKFRKVLMIGVRTNYDIRKEVIMSLEQITNFGTKGRRFIQEAEDYFITVRDGYPWSNVKDVVVGRPGYDNYLVSMAIQNKTTVIDITHTTLALHQTGIDGNFAGMHRKDKHVNKNMIGPFDYYSGLVSCAQVETAYDFFDNVYVVKKTRRCKHSKKER